MDDIAMIISKIDEIKNDNAKDHGEIKDNIRCLPCTDHVIRLTRLETLMGVDSDDKDKISKKLKLDDVVTRRIMYVFGGIIAGVVLLLKELPNIIKAVESLKR